MTLHNTYFDDICTGADSIEDVLNLLARLIQVLANYGLQLKKWTSNCNSELERIDPEDCSLNAVSYDDPGETFVRILGLHWDPVNDVIAYHVLPEPGVYTKRGVLSVIARLYDLVRFLALVTF